MTFRQIIEPLFVLPLLLLGVIVAQLGVYYLWAYFLGMDLEPKSLAWNSDGVGQLVEDREERTFVECEDTGIYSRYSCSEGDK